MPHRVTSDRPPRTFTVRTLTMVLAVATVVPMGIVAALLLDRLGDDGRTGRLNSLRAIAELYSDRVEHEFDAAIEALQVVAAALPSREADRHAFLRQALGVLAKEQAVRAMQLADMRGHVVADAAAPSVPAGTRTPLDPTVFDTVMRTARPFVGPVTTGPAGLSVPIGVPVPGRDETQAVLLALVATDALQHAISNGTSMRAVWSRTLVDPRGTIAARSRDAERFVGRPLPAEIAQALDWTAASVAQLLSLEGEPVYVAGSRGARYGWHSTVSVQVAAIEGPWQSTVRALGLLFPACAAIGVVLAWVFATRVSRGLGSIRAAVEALADGSEAPPLDMRVHEVARISDAIERSRRLLQAHEQERDAHLRTAEQAQRVAEGALAAADRAARAKDEFLAVLGHELRNPLAPIISALHLLKARGLEGTPEYAVVTRQVGHLTRLVDDLLDVSRIVQGKVELRRERLDLRDVLRQSLETADSRFRERGHTLHVTLGAQPLTVLGDRARLGQVVTNLLLNAAKYTPPGGQVWLQAGLDGSDVQVEIRDTGQGISAELLPHIFELFVQGRQAPDRQDGGLGLGLMVVRQMVLLHGGTVTAVSPGPGGGSTFTVRLPFALMTERRDAGAAGPDAVRPLRILVVDDNRDATDMLTRLLSLDGHTVAVAHDGPAALELAAHFAPEIALLDLGLPGMSGEDLGRALLATGPDAPRCVAITGYGQQSDLARTRTAGFAAHLLKPVEHETLRAVLAELAIGGRRTGSIAGQLPPGDR